MKKINIKKKNIYILSIVVVTIFLLIIILNKEEKAGQIIDGEVVYSNKINNVSIINNKEIIELNTINNKINSIIISKDMYIDIKNNSQKYNQSLSNYLKSDDISENEKYNINKSIELKMVNDKTRLKDYYVKVTGFKNIKSFLKFLDDAFKLVKEDKK